MKYPELPSEKLRLPVESYNSPATPDIPPYINMSLFWYAKIWVMIEPLPIDALAAKIPRLDSAMPSLLATRLSATRQAPTGTLDRGFGKV